MNTQGKPGMFLKCSSSSVHKNQVERIPKLEVSANNQHKILFYYKKKSKFSQDGKDE